MKSAYIVATINNDTLSIQNVEVYDTPMISMRNITAQSTRVLYEYRSLDLGDAFYGATNQLYDIVTLGKKYLNDNTSNNIIDDDYIDDCTENVTAYIIIYEMIHTKDIKDIKISCDLEEPNPHYGSRVKVIYDVVSYNKQNAINMAKTRLQEIINCSPKPKDCIIF